MSASKIKQLPRRQAAAIPALMGCKTIKDAAEIAGCHQETLYRWMKTPEFEAAYREARHVVMDEAFNVLQKNCTEAADTIIEIMRDQTALQSTRLQAAQVVLDMATRSRGIVELEDRVAELENDNAGEDAQAA